MTKKIFIDTSVFIRFLTKDDKEKYESCFRLIDQIEQGKLRPYISNIVIIEIIYVLNRQYSFPKKDVLSAVSELLKLRNLTLIESTDMKKSLLLFLKKNIKFQDCIITTQIPRDSTLITYDNEFKRIEGLKTMTPEQIVSET